MTTLIKIGHGAYCGANALRFCFSKAQAVRVLRNRGMTRDKARELIKDITERFSGYRTITIGGEIVEVSNMDWAVRENYYGDLKMLKKSWSDCSEL